MLREYYKQSSDQEIDATTSRQTLMVRTDVWGAFQQFDLLDEPLELSAENRGRSGPWSTTPFGLTSSQDVCCFKIDHLLAFAKSIGWQEAIDLLAPAAGLGMQAQVGMFGMSSMPVNWQKCYRKLDECIQTHGVNMVTVMNDNMVNKKCQLLHVLNVRSWKGKGANGSIGRRQCAPPSRPVGAPPSRPVGAPPSRPVGTSPSRYIIESPRWCVIASPKRYITVSPAFMACYLTVSHITRTLKVLVVMVESEDDGLAFLRLCPRISSRRASFGTHLLHQTIESFRLFLLLSLGAVCHHNWPSPVSLYSPKTSSVALAVPNQKKSPVKSLRTHEKTFPSYQLSPPAQYV
jgi:hypothetical protein